MVTKLWTLLGSSLCALVVGAGCSRGPQLGHVGRTFEPEPDQLSEESTEAEPPQGTAAASGRDEEPPPDDVVLRAALPFRGVRTSDGALLGPEALLSELARADAICVGERHDDPHDHYAQLATLRGLLERRDVGSFELALGLEMFPKPVQPVLDAFGKGKIDRDRLVSVTKYAEVWGFPIQYYAPQLESAREAGVALLALNAPRELTRAVAKDGLDKLPSNLAAELPELDLTSAAHRALFDRMMEGHPTPASGAPDPDALYAAQVVWDETMAERAATWLAGRAPARKLLILAGRAHCARPAIPSRVERRGRFRAVAVLPQVVDGPAPDLGDAQRRLEPSAVAPPPQGGDLERQLADAYDYRILMYKQ